MKTIIMVIIFMAVLAIGSVLIYAAFGDQYAVANIDKINNTGLLTNDTAAYQLINQTSYWTTSSLIPPIIIFLIVFGFIAVFLIVRDSLSD